MSRYENYSIKNNVHGSLYAPISSLATTIQLKDGEGARFSTHMLATLESVDTTGKVTKREIVLITGISGDTLTVTRKYAPCPASDDGNTQGQVSFSFDADDTINAYITKEHFDKIDDSINDIYENGVDKLRTDVVSGLEISVSAGPVLVGSAYYDFAGDTITLTNNATNYVEISENGELVANTTGWGDKNTKISKVVTSGGAVTSIEDWRLGTVGGEISKVNIHDLTEKSSLNKNDELIISDSENIYNNKKIKAKNVPNINGLDEKSVTDTNDLILIEDSKDSYNNKKIKVSNLLGCEDGIYTDTINKGDIVSFRSMLDGNIDYTMNVGDKTSTSKIGVDFYGNGNSGDFMLFYIKKAGAPGDFTVRIETDNDGKPSGTLANSNATGTISSSSLSTNFSLVQVDFNGEFTLNKGTKYWAVIDSPLVDSSNYLCFGFSNRYGLNVLWRDNSGANWVAPSESKTIDLEAQDYTSSSYTNIFYLYITPTAKFRLVNLNVTTYSQYISNITINNYNTSEQLYSGGKDNINFDFNIGVSYQIIITFTQNMARPGNLNLSTSVGTFTGGGQFLKILLDIVQVIDYKIKMSGDFVENIIGKVDTSDIKTFDDIIGIALEDGVKGDLSNMSVSGGIIQNDSRNLIIGQDYFYINNTLTNTYTSNLNMVYLGKAISTTEIKLDIKKTLYGLSSDIAPFTGLISGTPAIKGETVTGTLTAGF